MHRAFMKQDAYCPEGPGLQKALGFTSANKRPHAICNMNINLLGSEKCWLSPFCRKHSATKIFWLVWVWGGHGRVAVMRSETDRARSQKPALLILQRTSSIGKDGGRGFYGKTTTKNNNNNNKINLLYL